MNPIKKTAGESTKKTGEKRLTADGRLFSSTRHSLCRSAKPTNIPTLQNNGATAEKSRQKEVMEEEQKGKNLIIQKENRLNLCWLNQPAFSILRKELPKEMLERFYYNLLKD